MKARTVSHQAQEWNFTMDGYAAIKNKPFEVGVQTACEVKTI
jgi:hypothetical protein